MFSLPCHLHAINDLLCTCMHVLLIWELYFVGSPFKGIVAVFAGPTRSSVFIHSIAGFPNLRIIQL